MQRNNPPVIILVRPQMGENIGAVARAMSNFGLKELRLVAPRDGWPNNRANEVASGGEPIVNAAKVFSDVVSAMADIHIAYATTARTRDMEKPMVNVDEAIREINTKTESSAKIAILFGPERTGLENDDLSLCDTLIAIPTAPENPSLNLAQSAVIIGYEWFKQASENNNSAATQTSEPLASKQDWHDMFGQLETYLNESGYFRVADKKPIMWLNFKNMLLRGQWREQEMRSFRGALRLLWEGRKPRKK